MRWDKTDEKGDRTVGRPRTIAFNVLRKNLDGETIARTTGLTIEQLQQLQAEMR